MFGLSGFFHFYRLGDEDKPEATMVALDGDALLVFQWEYRRRPLVGWEEPKELLLRYFRPNGSGSLQWLASSSNWQLP